MSIPAHIPKRLHKYIVEQPGEYTPIDHAVWRFLLRQMRNYLGVHAHPVYAEGLEKTGVTIDRVPKISEMSDKLQALGWNAVPVSGFLPPAVFIEFQSLAVLPICADMRTSEHMLYTPSPDIVHEAAGHAPIVADPEFSEYLRRYGQAARRAIFCKEDLAMYEAIRVLSDLKENSDTTASELAAAEKQLKSAQAAMGEPSEAALMARMNWWTVEYGLIGSVDAPKIYGAGLLSSLGEAHWCLQDKVKKIPFSLECLEYDYDITEPQPQLFVTPDFATLNEALDQFTTTMAFRLGGPKALKKLRDSRTVNTVEYNTGLQVSGLLSDFRETMGGVSYIQFKGPVHLALQNTVLEGHGVERHAEGFGAPVGLLQGESVCLSNWSKEKLESVNIIKGARTKLNFSTGVLVDGEVKSLLWNKNKLLLVTFKDCRVTLGDEVLFDPAWGEYDMAVGSEIVSAYGGPADLELFGEDEQFAVKRVPPRVLKGEMAKLGLLYARVREMREKSEVQIDELEQMLTTLRRDHPKDWLLKLEILEIANKLVQKPSWLGKLREELSAVSQTNQPEAEALREGLAAVA